MIPMWRTSLVSLRCGLLALLLGGSLARAGLRVVGSDLLGDEFMREIVAHAGGAGQGVTPAFDGSRPGLEELRVGRADLAFVVLPSPELAGLESIALVPLGYYAVLIAAPAKCPLAEITLAQLARAFGGEPNPSSAAWGELGATGAWAAAPVVTLAPPASSGFTVDYFRHVVLREGELKPALRRCATPAELAGEFSGQAKPMALLAHARQCPAGARLLAVAIAAGQPAFLPTPEHLHAGQYPLAVPLHVAFRRERGEALAPMLRFLLSEKIAGILDRAGIVALSPVAREQERAKLEQR